REQERGGFVGAEPECERRAAAKTDAQEDLAFGFGALFPGAGDDDLADRGHARPPIVTAANAPAMTPTMTPAPASSAPPASAPSAPSPFASSQQPATATKAPEIRRHLRTGPRRSARTQRPM